MRLRAAGAKEINASGAIWAADAVSERWQDHFGPETLLNLADYIFQTALPQRLGKPWSNQAPDGDEERMVGKAIGLPAEPANQNVAEAAAKRQAERTKAGASRLIGLFSKDESQLAYAMLVDAVRAVGQLATADLARPCGRCRRSSAAG